MRKDRELPDGWEWKQLGDVAESISAGGTPRRNVQEYWKNGTIPWMKISDLKQTYVCKSDETITEEGLSNSSAKVFPLGTILYSIFATIGAMAILETPASTNQAIAGIIPDNTIVDTKYLYYCLQAEKKNIIAKKSHAVQDNINLSILRNHNILVPPLETQRKIVDILDSMEELKSLREDASAISDQLIRSTFLQMFGNPITNSKNYPIMKMGEFAMLSMGGTPNTKVEEYYEDGTINWMKSGDIKNNYICSVENKITELGFNNSNVKVYPKGSVVIALNGQGKTRGTTAILNIETTSNQSVACITVDDTIAVPEYLHFNLKYRYSEIRNLTGDKDRSGLNLTILRNVKVSLPSLELQQQFADLVQSIEDLKSSQTNSADTMDEMFNSFLDKAFRGELVC